MRLAGGENTTKQRYFFHVDNCKDPSKETFLHNSAKYYIKEKFTKSDSFYIEFDVEEVCCKEICRFDRRMCKRLFSNRYDLKRYYDKVEVEKHLDNGFQPDVYLTSKKHDADPIFVEIEVTHACSDEKLRLGTRIIEIKIPKDYDIEKHPLKLDCLKEGKMEQGIEVKFHNFNKSRHRVSERPYEEKEIRAIALKEDGRIVYIFNNLYCADYGKKVLSDSVVEVHLALDNYYRTVTSFKAIANLYGIPCKNCRFCSAQEYEFGRFTKKLICKHTKEKIRYGSEAETCSNYSFSRYEALKRAAEIDEKSYIVIDKEGHFVFPIFINEELEKKEAEMRNIALDIMDGEEWEKKASTDERIVDDEDEYGIYEGERLRDVEEKVMDLGNEIGMYGVE